ncbi:hypothetical protein J41TS12_08070 [Paenibacillus antibioticophila]|uniref:Uncharacterized protein n=2 Tax=Paenibacillus antibioticophila TaxID=1274374 RepID=A0A919XMW9_9BACL|nr:hypothetical protein J41TS12_08070 [Paenibacillus antibioticophila]
MPNTQISNGSEDLHDYWDWHEQDAYLSVGGLTSNVTDMLAYAQLQLSEEGSFSPILHRIIKFQKQSLGLSL